MLDALPPAGAENTGMKHVAMSNPKDKPVPSVPQKSRASDAAFDVWLNRGLHQLFDDVANEPIPEDLLKLIEDDKTK